MPYSNTLATWCEEMTHFKRPWGWERWKAGGEGDDRGWDVWMASLTQWTWVWVNSGSWWWTRRPGVLQSLGSQRVGYDWVTELNWTDAILRGSLIAQLVKIHLQCRRLQFHPWVRKICWRRDKLPTPVFLGFPCGSAGKESSCNEGDLDSIPGLGRSPGEGKGYPLQRAGLENSMDCIAHGVTTE